MPIIWTALTLVLSVTLAIAENSTTVTLYDGANCSSESPQYVWEPGAQDATTDGGNCVETLPATAFSLMFSQLQPGCKVTIYSDVWCSNDAILAELNACADLGDELKIRSFSIDACDIPFSKSGNTTNTTTASTSQGHDGLSSAAKGGIAAGVICGVLLVAGILVAALIWFKRRRAKASTLLPNNSADHQDQPSELPGEQVFELSSPRGSEMPAEKEKQEMATKTSVAELRSKSSVRIVLPQELEGDHP